MGSEGKAGEDNTLRERLNEDSLVRRMCQEWRTDRRKFVDGGHRSYFDDFDHRVREHVISTVSSVDQRPASASDPEFTPENYCYGPNSLPIEWIEVFDGQDTKNNSRHVKSFSKADGKPGGAAGAPGLGGGGGIFTSTVEIDKSWYTTAVGDTGAPQKPAKGGNAAVRKTLGITIRHQRKVNGRGFSWTYYGFYVNEPRKGQDGYVPPVPTAAGDRRDYQLDSSRSSYWMRPEAAEAVLHYAEDLYGLDVFDEATQVLSDLATDLQPVRNLDDYQRTIARSEDLLARLAGNLDYRGNKVGWVPKRGLGSWAELMSKYLNAYYEALPTIERVRLKAETAEVSLKDLSDVKEKSRAAITREIEKQNQLIELWGRVSDEIDQISREEASVKEMLAHEMQIAEKLAEAEAVKQKKLALLRTVAKVMQYFPYGQPYLGVAGSIVKTAAGSNRVQLGEVLQSAVGAAMSVQTKTTDFDKLKVDVAKLGEVTRQLASAFDSNGRSGSYGPDSKAVKAGTDQILAARAEVLSNVRQAMSVSRKDIQVQLDRILAEDNTYKSLLKAVDTLAGDKQHLSESLQNLSVQIGEFGERLDELVRIADVTDSAIRDNLTVLNHPSVILVAGMEKILKDDLEEIEYRLIRALEYRTGQRYTGSRGAVLSAEKIRGYLNDSSQAPGEALRLAFTEEVQDIVKALVKNDPGQQTPVQRKFTLTNEQITELNAQLMAQNATTARVSVDLLDTNQANIALEDLELEWNRVVSITCDCLSNTSGEVGEFFIDLKERGVKRGQNGRDQVYLLEGVKDQAIYRGTLRVQNGASRVDDSVDSSKVRDWWEDLRSLMGINSDRRSELANPPLLPGMDLRFVKGQSNTVKISHLEVVVSYWPRDNTGISGVHLFAMDTKGVAMSTPFALDRSDSRGLQDGQGAFTRLFLANGKVEIVAPAMSDDKNFLGWYADDKREWDANARVSPTNHLTVDLNNKSSWYKAVYQSSGDTN